MRPSGNLNRPFSLLPCQSARAGIIGDTEAQGDPASTLTPAAKFAFNVPEWSVAKPDAFVVKQAQDLASVRTALNHCCLGARHALHPPCQQSGNQFVPGIARISRNTPLLAVVFHQRLFTDEW